MEENIQLKNKIEKLNTEVRRKEEYIQCLYKKFGRTFENFAPFTKKFPGDKSKCVFLGKPIDFIIFENNKIIFVEVKTRTAFLSENQKRIKKQIEEGKIEFKEVRY